MQTPTHSLLRIISIEFLIVGNIIGIGILALPINTGLAGFIPSVIGLFVTSAAMYYSAVILGGEASKRREDTFNYPSLYRTYLGATGKWLAVAANLVILYGYLTAYMTGIATIICSLFNFKLSPAWLMLGFFAITSIISLASVYTIMKYVSMLVVVKCVAFAVISGIAGTHVRAENLAHANWSLFFCVIPVMLTAFHFHNIIPAICKSLQWDRRVINLTMLVGMAFCFLIYFIWLLVGIGVLPLDNSPIGLINAFHKNLPATIPMAEVIQSSTFLLIASFFWCGFYHYWLFGKWYGTNRIHGRPYQPALQNCQSPFKPCSLIYPTTFDRINLSRYISQGNRHRRWFWRCNSFWDSA